MPNVVDNIVSRLLRAARAPTGRSGRTTRAPARGAADVADARQGANCTTEYTGEKLDAMRQRGVGVSISVFENAGSEVQRTLTSAGSWNPTAKAASRRAAAGAPSRSPTRIAPPSRRPVDDSPADSPMDDSPADDSRSRLCTRRVSMFVVMSAPVITSTSCTTCKTGKSTAAPEPPMFSPLRAPIT